MTNDYQLTAIKSLVARTHAATMLLNICVTVCVVILLCNPFLSAQNQFARFLDYYGLYYHKTALTPSDVHNYTVNLDDQCQKLYDDGKTYRLTNTILDLKRLKDNLKWR